jgi:zinc protease
MKASIIALSLTIATTAVAADFEVPKEETWRGARPKPGELKEPKLPTFQKAVLDNGLTLLVAESSALPLVSFALVIKGGSAIDPADKAGLTAITYAMLDEGAGDYDVLAFADQLADLGASFGTSGDRDTGAASISGLSRNADAMVRLLTLAVTRPRLGQEDFERVKAQTLAAMERRRSSPQGLAFDELPGLIYGDKHPLGHPPTGTPASVASITLEDVKKHHASSFGPKSSALIVSGALTLAEAQSLANKHLGDWTSDAKVPPPIPKKDPEKRTTVVILDKAPAPQTTAIVGRPIFGKGHKDEAALTLANVVYGGAFTSRLNLNLREAKGYTYGAGSQAIFRQGVGAFVAVSALRLDVTAPGLHETMVELEGMKKKPPTKEEVEDAKSNMIRSLTGDFETTSASAGAAAAIFVNDLALDYFQKLPDQYGAVTVDQVRKAARTYLDPTVMKILLVGDATTIAPSVEKLKLGKIEIRKP